MYRCPNAFDSSFHRYHSNAPESAINFKYSNLKYAKEQDLDHFQALVNFKIDIFKRSLNIIKGEAHKASSHMHGLSNDRYRKLDVTTKVCLEIVAVQG